MHAPHFSECFCSELFLLSTFLGVQFWGERAEKHGLCKFIKKIWG